MTTPQKLFLFIARISVGWYMFYAGVTKIIDPTWSSAGYLKGAKAFVALFHWFASPGVLPIINFVNEWGLTLLGISLILGIGIRLSCILGAILMFLYWLPLGFPQPDAHSYIVDDHIIFAAMMLFFAAIHAGRVWGLENVFPKLGRYIG